VGRRLKRASGVTVRERRTQVSSTSASADVRPAQPSGIVRGVRGAWAGWNPRQRAELTRRNRAPGATPSPPGGGASTGPGVVLKSWTGPTIQWPFSARSRSQALGRRCALSRGACLQARPASRPYSFARRGGDLPEAASGPVSRADDDEPGLSSVPPESTPFPRGPAGALHPATVVGRQPADDPIHGGPP